MSIAIPLLPSLVRACRRHHESFRSDVLWCAHALTCHAALKFARDVVRRQRWYRQAEHSLVWSLPPLVPKWVGFLRMLVISSPTARRFSEYYSGSFRVVSTDERVQVVLTFVARRPGVRLLVDCSRRSPNVNEVEYDVQSGLWGKWSKR